MAVDGNERSIEPCVKWRCTVGPKRRVGEWGSIRTCFERERGHFVLSEALCFIVLSCFLCIFLDTEGHSEFEERFAS